MTRTGETRTGGDYLFEAPSRTASSCSSGSPVLRPLPLDRVVADRDELRYVMSRHGFIESAEGDGIHYLTACSTL